MSEDEDTSVVQTRRKRRPPSRYQPLPLVAAAAAAASKKPKRSSSSRRDEEESEEEEQKQKEDETYNPEKPENDDDDDDDEIEEDWSERFRESVYEPDHGVNLLPSAEDAKKIVEARRRQSAKTATGQLISQMLFNVGQTMRAGYTRAAFMCRAMSLNVHEITAVLMKLHNEKHYQYSLATRIKDDAETVVNVVVDWSPTALPEQWRNKVVAVLGSADSATLSNHVNALITPLDKRQVFVIRV